MIGKKIVSSFDINTFVKVIVEDVDNKGFNKVYFGTIIDKADDFLELEQTNKIKTVVNIKYIISVSEAERR